MARKSYVVMPNAILSAPGHSASKRLLLAMLAYSMPRRRKGQEVYSTAKTYAQLRQISGIASDTTLSTAISELCKAGILRRTQNFGYNRLRQRMERRTNTYALDRAYLRHLSGKSGYTLVPRELLKHELTNAQLAIALLLYQYAGSRGVARPSIRAIAAKLHLALSTVVLALRQLRKLELFIRIHHRYVGRHGGVAYHINRYCCTANLFVRKACRLAKITVLRPNTGQLQLVC